MRIHHIAIWTHNLETLKDFYQTFFDGQIGTKYHNPTTGFESYFVSFDSGPSLEIMQKPAVPTTQNDPIQQATGYTHVAFSLGSETAVDKKTAQLEQHGYRVASHPRRTGDGYYESVILDPDGNRVEIAA